MKQGSFLCWQHTVLLIAALDEIFEIDAYRSDRNRAIFDN